MSIICYHNNLYVYVYIIRHIYSSIKRVLILIIVYVDVSYIIITCIKSCQFMNVFDDTSIYIINHLNTVNYKLFADAAANICLAL